MAAEQTYEFQSFVLSASQFRLTHEDRPIAMEPQAFSILLYLVEHRDRVVTKDELLDQFWANKVVTEASITHEIRQVRKALGDSGRTQAFVRTVHGRGYQFVADVHEAKAPDAQNPEPKKRADRLLEYREAEVRDIQLHLRKSPMGVLTLVGPGGIGKTTLAKSVMTAMRSEYADGIWFVDLLAATSTQDVLDQLVLSLGLSTAVPDGIADEQNYAEAIGYAIAGKHCLIVLDNFEHVQSAARAVSQLVERAEVPILVTSRQRLSIKMETALTLQGLSTQSTQHALSDAARLFCQRADQYNDVSMMTEEDRQRIEHICARVGGTPLAIEMAAAWLRYLPLRDLEADIDRSLQWLETDLVDVPERQRSTQRIFDYSWDKLSAQEQSGLARLAIWPLGFTRSVGQSWAGLSLPELVNLERVGLVTLNDSGFYTLHELIRQMALDKAKSGGTFAANFTDFTRYLELKGRLIMHLGQYASTVAQARIDEIRILSHSFDQHLDWFVQAEKFAAIKTYFFIGFNAFKTARWRTRRVDRYLPILKPHEPYEFYLTVSIEKLVSLVWQHHDNFDQPLAQATALFEELTDESGLYRARIAAIIGQMCRVNQRIESGKVWAQKAIELFAAADTLERESLDEQTTANLCLSWAYAILDDYQTALAHTDQALRCSHQNSPDGYWYGGFATKAWNLAYLGEETASYQHSSLLFNEALDRHYSEFLTIWTIQAAQTAELFQDDESAATFLAFSEYYLHAFSSEDLVEGRRTQEVLEFLDRLKGRLGEADYQAALTRWHGYALSEVIAATQNAFDARSGGRPTRIAAYFAEPSTSS